MDTERISVSLELELSGESLTGRAGNGSGPTRGFAGWLGLLGAIDAIVEEHRRGGDRGAEPPPGEDRGPGP